MKISKDILDTLSRSGAYQPGDWVVLGNSGSGWASNKTGSIVQIADIGPHLKGTLYWHEYDFYVTEESYGPGQLSRPSRGGGDSRNILRFATVEEIERVR